MDPHFEGVIFQTHAAELVKRLQHQFPRFCAVDVRDASAFTSGHVPGALRATPEDLTRSLPEGTDPATEFIVIGSGPTDPAVRRASLALRSHGARRVVEFSGGMAEWLDYGYDTARQSAA